MMNAEPSVDLDTWCFWLNVSLNPLGYAAAVPLPWHNLGTKQRKRTQHLI